MSCKKNVILAPGPLHLFWVTGIYYLWELSKIYGVVLVVDENYQKDQMFLEAIALCNVKKILYTPNSKDIFARHRHYAKEFKDLVFNYKPVFVFQHNCVYIPNLYLFYFSQQANIKCKRIVYLNAMQPINWKEDFQGAVLYNVYTLANRYKFQHFFALVLYRIKSWLFFILEYYLIPVMYCRVRFRPIMNPYTRTIIRWNWVNQFDYLLIYYRIEKDVLQEVYGPETKTMQIQHPVITSGSQVHNTLYGVLEEPLVIILPSYGYINLYMKNRKISQEEIVKEVSEKWIRAIEKITHIFPGMKVIWKLHPRQIDDYLWQSITDQIKVKIPDIVVLPPNENAQKWILRSKVVISEVSTTLWWTAFIHGKIPISLNVLGVSYCNDFKYFEGVFYFSTLSDFLDCEINNYNEGQAYLISSRESLPTLSSLVKSLEAMEE